MFLLAGYAPSIVNFRLPLIKKLVAAGATVAVGASKDEFLAQDISLLGGIGIPIYDLPVARNEVNPLASVQYTLAVRSALRDFGCNIFIPYTIKPVTFGTFGARLAGVKRIFPMVTGLGSAFIGEAPGLRGRLIRFLAARLYRAAFGFAEAIHFQNVDDPRDLDKIGGVPRGAKIGIMAGSGVDLLHFTPMPLPSPGSPFVFLMIARLIGDKGVREFARATRIVREQLPNTRFHLVAEYSTNPTAIRKEELASWTWIDHTPWLDDVRTAIKECSVYVLPSYREGMSRSVLEAMACGRAIITTDAPGCREPIENGGNGILVPVRDAEALASAMLELARDRPRVERMGRRSRQLAVQKYDAQHVYDNFLSVVLGSAE